MTSIDLRLQRVQRRTSEPAQWCQRLAVFAVPYLAIVVLGHRFGMVETPQVFWLLGLGVAILVVALGFGIRGFYELWQYGHTGGMRSLRGMTLAALLLAPFGFFAAKVVALPRLHDISTDLQAPPVFEVAIGDRVAGMNRLGEPDPNLADVQIRAYPQVAARRYPLGSGQVFTEVVALMADRGWTILATELEQGQAPIDEEGSGLVANAVTDENGTALRPAVPSRRPVQQQTATPASGPVDPISVSPLGRDGIEGSEPTEERYVEAVASSFVMGFESDIVVRLIEGEDGTLVDMRSASRYGPHDLGSNADRIVAFLSDLDDALQGQASGS